LEACQEIRWWEAKNENLIHGKWGHWKLNRKAMALTLEIHPWYEIDLERIRDSAEMLDWIFQIFKKTWATPDIIYDVLNAFESIFEPQANLSSFGRNKEINPKLFIQE
jgi:hypothetical protein